MTPRDTLFTVDDPEDDPERELLVPQRVTTDRIARDHDDLFTEVFAGTVRRHADIGVTRHGNDALERLITFFEEIPR